MILKSARQANFVISDTDNRIRIVHKLWLDGFACDFSQPGVLKVGSGVPSAPASYWDPPVGTKPPGPPVFMDWIPGQVLLASDGTGPFVIVVRILWGDTWFARVDYGNVVHLGAKPANGTDPDRVLDTVPTLANYVYVQLAAGQPGQPGYTAGYTDCILKGRMARLIR